MADSTPSEPRPNLELRVADADRSRVAAELRQHCTDGRITLGELTDRLDHAYRAVTLADLYAVTSDLPTPARRPASSDVSVGDISVHAGRRPGHAVAARGLLYTFVCVSIFLSFIWLLAGAGYFWPVWPMLGMGLAYGIVASWSIARRAS